MQQPRSDRDAGCVRRHVRPYAHRRELAHWWRTEFDREDRQRYLDARYADHGDDACGDALDALIAHDDADHGDDACGDAYRDAHDAYADALWADAILASGVRDTRYDAYEAWEPNWV